ncbi:MAG: hypothetical protein JWP97_5742 [Labilithrix sp.]|nr:hypothetical protein [Labilithrix sp.]
MTLDEQCAPTMRPDTLPTPPPVRVCGCGRSHDRDEWQGLRLVGLQEDGEGGELELRNCQCGSTLAIERAA